MDNPSGAIPRVMTLARDQAHKINSNILDGKSGDVRKMNTFTILKYNQKSYRWLGQDQTKHV